jgi:hypothetical protein
MTTSVGITALDAGVWAIDPVHSSIGFAVRHHQRNAKLQLTVVLTPAEAVPGLYVHPDHRRRRRRPDVRSELDV